MSHFAVMIIGDNQEEQLAKYDEGIEMPEYKDSKVSKSDKDSMVDYYSRNKGFKGTFEECCAKFGDDWNGNRYRKDENGVWCEYSTYNPNSKWDWYVIGGRWGGLIQLKKGVKPLQPVNFSWGWEEEDKQRVIRENRADIAYKKDIENFDDLVCFALVKDGEWYERGSMGWWGIVSEEKPDEEWESEFKRLVSELPDNTLISIYDCHI